MLTKCLQFEIIRTGDELIERNIERVLLRTLIDSYYLNDPTVQSSQFWIQEKI